MLIVVSSRKDIYENIETHASRFPAVISILDIHKMGNNQKPIETDRPLLSLRFSDATSKSRIKKIKLMTMKDAEAIVEFVENRPDNCRCIIVHCNRGRSRSAAIATALHYGFYGHLGNFVKKPYKPNEHVLTLTLRVIEKVIRKISNDLHD